MRSLSLLIFSFFVGFSFSGFSQTTTQIQALQSQSEQTARIYLQKKAAAVEWAKHNGFPIREEAGGSLIEIQYLDNNGRPQYYKTDNSVAAVSISTNKVYAGGGAGLSLTGSGITVREWDGGSVLSTHQEFGTRVTNVDAVSTHYHSTHVAGTIMASGVVSSSKGMAFQASLRSLDWNSDISELASEGAAGALISNHSYGYIRGWYNGTWYGEPSISTQEDYLFGFYDYDTQQWDQVARDAPYFLICKSAGNDRGDSGPGYPADGPYDCIGQQGVAKNILTVGAVDDIPGGYTSPSSVTQNYTDFSSWGPADDGRIKPDIVANGYALYSTDNTNNTSYATLSGTSMSTPSAAGSLALLQQHFNTLNGVNMRSATLKALVIHTADEAGSYTGPDYMFGWGLMNTKNAALRITADQTTDVISELTLNNGNTYTRNVVALGSEPLKVTIVWTDPAGTPPSASLDPITPMLVNDLDLRLTRSGNTYYPWKLDRNNPSNAATNAAENNVDNVEVVYIASPVAGATYSIVVDHDGTINGGSQAFSIIISGIQSGPYLTVTPSNQDVAPVAGSTTFNVITGSAWTAVSNQSWCTVTSSGTGNGTLTANYNQNSTSSSRVANITVTISGLSPVVVTVTQAAPTLSVTPGNQSVASSAGSTSFSVTTNSSWTATSSQIWCSVTSSGTGNGTITANYSANPTVLQRVANITITVPGLTSQLVTVTQAASPPTLNVSPTNQPVSAAAGNVSFTVTSNADWTATSNQTWCSVTPSGSGNGTLIATYSTNNTTSSRVANITVTVSGLTPIVVTVTQAAPTLSVTPSNQSVPYTSGNTSFSVTSNSDWTVTSDQTWCTVTPSGSGNGSISAAYELNSSPTARVANITVTVPGMTPVVVTVSQTGAATPEFNYTIANDVQISDKILEFDLYLLDTPPSSPFELSVIQAGILVNSAIINGGTITTAIVSGFSELVPLQQPTGAIWTTGTPNGCIKITPKAGPGCGSGTIISTTGQGTRICRIRITNTVAFTSGSQANLAFNFTTSPYPTKVFQYTGTPCSSVQQTTNATNCFSQASNPVLNGPPYLSVSPSDRAVSNSSGTTNYSVTSNASWTAISNQTWCTVASSGFGNGSITANFTENTDPSPRVANITVTVAGVTPVIVTLTQAGAPIRNLNLTVFLEGLYNGNSIMNPAMDENGYHWGETIADKINIELHDGSDYSNIIHTVTDVPLNTDGTITVTLSSAYNGNYYMTITHRNHILTTTAFPVPFNTSTVSYNFDSPSKAYGGNLALMIDGKYVFYGADVNQDYLVDGSDLSNIGNLANIAASGYLPEDVNGDGLVDGSDLSITGNNADIAVGSMTP